MSHQLWTSAIKYNITPNQLYFLDCCREKIKPIESLINIHVEKNICELKGLITDKGVLTHKALLILDEFDAFQIKNKRKTTSEVLGDDFKKNVEIYRNIFPKGRLKHGPARQSVRELTSKFIWFFKHYPDYGWELIFDATDFYVYEQKKENDHKFLSNSSNFIKKDTLSKETTSKLADYCEMITNNPEVVDELNKENE